MNTHERVIKGIKDAALDIDGDVMMGLRKSMISITDFAKNGTPDEKDFALDCADAIASAMRFIYEVEAQLAVIDRATIMTPKQ